MKTPFTILFISLFIFSSCVYAPRQAWKPNKPVKDQTQTYQPVYIKEKKKKQADKEVEGEQENRKKKKQDNNEDKAD